MIFSTTYLPKFPLPAMGGYRYFFNGQEADNEALGDGALHAFEYRMHDTRIGRFWSVDPLAGKFPWNSVYAFAENRVVDGRELEGLEYLDADVCRWVFQSDGAYINTENLSPLCKKMYMASVKDIDKILKDPNQQFIPQKYMNPLSLAKIMNVILFGKNYTEDPKIYEIGIKIFNQTGRMRPLDPNRNKE